MSDPSNPWMPDWQSMQKQLFSAWTDAARGNPAMGGMGGMGGFGNPQPIPEGFDAWMKLMGGASQGNQTLDKVVGSAKQFAEFMQGVVGQLATNPMESMTPAAMRAGMEKALGGFSKKHNPVLSAFEGITANGAQGMEDLYREFMKAAQPLMNEAKGQLSTPTFGLQREQQERQQALLRSMGEYAEKSSRFQALLYKASRVGLDKFESKLEERSEPGRQITSMRGLYDVFVDASEEGYAEVALSDEFREAYGEMVNAQMRVRQAVQGEVERSTAALGMPSRSELDTVHKRMHDMRRQMADLQERLQAADDAAAPRSAPAEAPAKTRAPAVPRATATSSKPRVVRSAKKPTGQNGDATAAEAKPAAAATRRKRS
jgi:hypothetical protein